MNLNTVSDNSHYCLRPNRKKRIVHVRPNTDYLKQSIQFITTTVWNQTPLNIKNLNIYIFLNLDLKHSYKKILTFELRGVALNCIVLYVVFKLFQCTHCFCIH